MTWRDIERLMHDRFDVGVEVRRGRNKYWFRQGDVHYSISSPQFEKLLEYGYIDPYYKIEHRSGQYGADLLVYRGR